MTPTAIALLKIFEGFRPQPYGDPIGLRTIGFGHRVLSGEDWSKGITPTEAEILLVKDFELHKSAVVSGLGGKHAEEWELEAMTSLCFNVGPAKFLGSTLLKLFCSGNRRGAAMEFLKWVNAGGAPYPGLVKRRNIECIWFLGAADQILLDFVKR